MGSTTIPVGAAAVRCSCAPFAARPSSKLPASSSSAFIAASNNPSRFPNLNKAGQYTSSVSTRLPLHGATVDDVEVSSSSSGLVGENDLLVVGPGVLGRLVAECWWKEYPGCQIYGQTATAQHHDELMKLGIKPSLKGRRTEHQFPFVIFCAPPSQTSDYPGDVRLAASNWNGEGAFLFTSSSALFDRNDNGLCDEDTPAVPVGMSRRTDVLLKAEEVVLESGGCVLRLAGLYKADRGAHNYWLMKGTIEARPDHILSLIHYEDAASLSAAILKKKLRAQIFLGCDDHPLSRQELMDLVNRSGKYSQKFTGFTGTDGPLGKALNNSKTRKQIGWQPRYPSFAQFLGISG